VVEQSPNIMSKKVKQKGEIGLNKPTCRSPHRKGKEKHKEVRTSIKITRKKKDRGGQKRQAGRRGR